MGAVALGVSLLVWAGACYLIKKVNHEIWLEQIQIDDRIHHH